MPDQTASTLPMPPGGPRKPPLKEFGGYQIEGELGRGGMGVVYLARQIELNRHVALKMLTGHYGPDELHRFLEESETAAALNHTNIAHVYEVGEHEGAPFFSMEYVKAGSLADRLRGELPEPRDAAKLLLNVARGLHFAHQNGIVHRDMKPANILLDQDGIPKITDFGIAKRLNDDTKLTRTGAVIGTPTYMAPEQAKGNSRHVGPAADIYSLGAILYEMLTGRPPFLPEDSETPITVRVLTEDPVSPAWHRPEIPRDLETICRKCLEKEPRNRYESAAALAEDLRRFLDDESILARPPTTAARSIKWVRRHPWKFVAFATALLLVVGGLARLAQWELYERPRTEYAARVDWVNGGLEPVEKISLENASRRAAYLRLTRRGRLGPVTKVEVLNARGNPAVLRWIFSYDEFIPIYIEGITGLQPLDERRSESATVEFLYDDSNRALEATSRDRNGQVNWRLIYDRRHASDSSGNNAGARFVNVRGFDATSRDGASHLEFERDARGRDMKVTFFNAAGRPAANGEGVYGYKLERDDAGRVVQLVNLGSDGRPAANRMGMTAFSINWGKVVRLEMRDANGQPTAWNGIAAMVMEHDDAGNAIRFSNLDAEGRPVRDAAAALSVQELTRNEHGELTQRTDFKAGADGTLKDIGQAKISYDEFGHPADVQFFGPVSGRIALRHDANGNAIEEKYLDAQGNPIAGDEGYAIKRLAYTPGPEGLRLEETYFDAAGEKTYSTGGYHRTISELDSNGNLRRMVMDEHDPAQHAYHRVTIEVEFDPQGRKRHSTTRFEDAEGNPATGPALSYNVSETFYDENERPTTDWTSGRDPTNFGGPVWRVDTEWHSNGKMKRRVRQVCDEKRQPLPFISNGNAARYEEEFDADEILERTYETGFDEELLGFTTREAKFSGGNLQRIYETGFDENRVGFGTREAKFSGGNFQSVTHRRGDGTALDSVRVIITKVFPTEAQPKNTELKVGDQLVAANGKPVTSAYAWMAGGGFSGGWVEVLREGRRIRIDGFNPGKLGVYLEDRASAGGGDKR